MVPAAPTCLLPEQVNAADETMQAVAAAARVSPSFHYFHMYMPWTAGKEFHRKSTQSKLSEEGNIRLCKHCLNPGCH